MKKIVLAIIIIMLLITGCGSGEVLSSTFKMDLEQVLSVIDKSHEAQVQYTENENDLLENFKNKYKFGQYFVNKDEGYSEMNDLEKAIFNEVLFLRAINIDFEDKESILASDKAVKGYYEDIRDEIDMLMGIKDIDKLPDEYKDRYRTYEVGAGIYPEQFEKDMRELIETFEPIVNGDVDTVDEDDSRILAKIFNDYNITDGDGPSEYKQNDKYYLVNENMLRNLKTTIALVKDLDGGLITSETRDKFNILKEDMEVFGRQ